MNWCRRMKSCNAFLFNVWVCLNNRWRRNIRLSCALSFLGYFLSVRHGTPFWGHFTLARSCNPFHLRTTLYSYYLNSVPNFILAFIPAEISGDTLNTMTAFAVRVVYSSPGIIVLICDVDRWFAFGCFFAFSSTLVYGWTPRLWCSFCHGRRKTEYPRWVKISYSEIERVDFNFSSLGIFVGFAAFFFMEKTLRVLGGDEDAHSHSHSHSHSQPHVSPEVIKNSSIKGSGTEDGPRGRIKTSTNSSSPSPEIPKTAHGPSKLSAYLNLFGDFVHNMLVLEILLFLQMTLFFPNSTDGLAWVPFW